MGSKRCGNCKWWDRDKTFTYKGDRRRVRAKCNAPVPAWVPTEYDGITIDDMLETYNAERCPTFKLLPGS